MTAHRPLIVRLYGAALRRLPRNVRDEYAEQMLAVFTELAAEARDRRGARGELGVLIAELPGLVVLAA